MTRMLAFVSTLAEAETVLAGGADIIAMKSDVVPGVVGATVAAIGGRRPVSAVSALPRQGDLAAAALSEMAATGVDYISVDIFPGADAAWVAQLAGCGLRAKLIAVFTADELPDGSVLSWFGRSGFAGAMIDTEASTPRRLLDHLDIHALLGFLQGCRDSGLLAGLAGSLEMPDIPRLLVLEPDLLGFGDTLRDATGQLDLASVRTVRGLIPQEHPIAGIREVDYRLLGNRGAAVTGESAPVDLVFVEDLVLPVFIGAYARERETPQNVRFAVTASVLRTGRLAEDMRDVFSYDLITDGIRLLVGSGHVALVETLAERIASMVLGHPRVTKVVVRVQKLETGSGTVGVEIERLRKNAWATDDRPVVPLLVEAPKSVSGSGLKP
jgi:FolB domain-containing protein